MTSSGTYNFEDFEGLVDYVQHLGENKRAEQLTVKTQRDKQSLGAEAFAYERMADLMTRSDLATGRFISDDGAVDEAITDLEIVVEHLQEGIRSLLYSKNQVTKKLEELKTN